MDRIKCWYNTPLQVLTEAPALHTLIVFAREDVADILEFRNHIHGDLKKLVLEYCWSHEDKLIPNIVAMYTDLEVLSMRKCGSITFASYCLIPHLKELSELNISFCQVLYVYVKKPLETHVCIHEHM
jgi:hypothetical protein